MTSSDILAAQLADVLVEVPLSDIELLDTGQKMIVMDWVEVVRNQSGLMRHVPVCEINAIRRWMRPEQLAGLWTAFTKWRPATKQKEQRGLFAEDDEVESRLDLLKG